jgi:hypothetical protein
MATAIIRRWDGTSSKSFRFDPSVITPFMLFELLNKREGKLWRVVDIWQKKPSSQHDCQITCNGDLIDTKLMEEEVVKATAEIQAKFERLHALGLEGGV